MIYFKEPRLNLSIPAEFLVRLVIYSFYAVLTAITLILFFSNASQLKWLSILLGIFLLDRLLHFGQGDKSLNELGGEKINLAETITSATFRILNYSFRKAIFARRDFYLILLKELMKRRDASEALKRLSISDKEFGQKIEEFLNQTPEHKVDRIAAVASIESLVVAAYENARAVNEKFIEPRNILVALALSKDPEILKIFDLFKLDVVDLQEAITFGRYKNIFSGFRRLPAVLGGFAHTSKFLRRRIMNRAWTARPTPTLDQFSQDLTDLARAEKVGFLIGHEQEFEALLNAISRSGKPNALLVGEAGVGKSTMIAHLAFRMIKDQVPPALFDKRLVSLEIADLIANAPSEVLAGRLQKIAEEITLAGNIILFIPNIHDLFRTGQNKTISAIDIILPMVRNENIPLIGETYPREFKQFIEPRSDFLDQFEVVNVEEINEAEATRLLVYNSLIFERQYKIFITFRAVRSAVQIAHRYLRNKVLPGSALDLLKGALSKASQNRMKVLTEESITQIAEGQIRIPIQKAGLNEAQKLLNLESTIHERLINQDMAVSAVSRALREYRSGLSRKGGPIATFLFVGPTGVGKTELAKTLARVQFGTTDAMVRFDMSEYQDKQSIFRFIGTPDGEKTGALTDAILAKPYSLILLDEFEKAYPDILNLFLQVFDDGRLTDSLNRTVDFGNTIIIATSNAHSEFIKTEIEKGRTVADLSDELKKKLTGYFKPELLNRFSDVIVFRNLTPDEIVSVAKILINLEVIALLKESHGIDLRVDDSAIKKIAELGYSPVFGARPLRQVISEKIRGVLAEKILRQEIERGHKINLSFSNGEFVFSSS